MSFDVSPDAYARYMGRFSEPLAETFVRAADLEAGDRALDVGCGPRALTALQVRRLGEYLVSAIDPFLSFVTRVRERFPLVDDRSGTAESLPFADDTFDATMAQLVVHFMTDPVAGLREMTRVTRPGGIVAACVWDHGGGCGPLATFWQAVHDTDPDARDESGLAGTREGQLAAICLAAGLGQVESTSLTVRLRFSTFDDWWDPFTLGGPAGAYVAGLDDARRVALRTRCLRLLPSAPFEVTASAWCATARGRDVTGPGGAAPTSYG